MSNRLTVTAATGYSGRYRTRTMGEAHLYRVIQYYDRWPFETSSRVRAGTASRRRTETFRTLEPARQRLARANFYARNQRRDGGDWASFVAVAEQLTGNGWQPLDLDVLPPRPAARRGRPAQNPAFPPGHRTRRGPRTRTRPGDREPAAGRARRAGPARRPPHRPASTPA